MEIKANYRRLTPIEFDYLMQHPEVEADFFDIDVIELTRAGRYLNIGIYWDGLHYLLTGQNSIVSDAQIPPPLCDVVMSGRHLLYELTDSAFRYLAPDEVRAVADLLHTLNEDKLRANFWRNLPQAGKVYAFGGDESGLAILMETFGQVRDFFVQAAQAGDVMLLSSD